ncbi:Rz1-like lysis system protein LysC [Aliamphritea hakodatensis]|uniref:Rz1-like lysis system protein LysC n=1 Tax=Aliamphritea hakodatensis TaxID=2895352 RepID=UPI00406BCF3F
MTFKRVMTKLLMLASLLMLLSGCGSSGTVITETVRDPVPNTWTVPVQAPSLSGTFGEYIAQCEAAIKQSNADKRQIREWSESE